MVFLLGDFNAQVGRNRDIWYSSLGKFGVGKENSNNYRLLQICRYLGYTEIQLQERQQTLLIMLL